MKTFDVFFPMAEVTAVEADKVEFTGGFVSFWREISTMPMPGKER